MEKPKNQRRLELMTPKKLEVIEEILCVARRQTRSIVRLCEEFDDRRKVQNLPIRTIFYDTSGTN